MWPPTFNCSIPGRQLKNLTAVDAAANFLPAAHIGSTQYKGEFGGSRTRGKIQKNTLDLGDMWFLGVGTSSPMHRLSPSCFSSSGNTSNLQIRPSKDQLFSIVS
ncbi:hypothetical protein Taro_053510 [Colocasia esculenta]|uniref:Uncharacterized protein n=1 Tax=Colocasia esculenta TaxID=4460 RepID=A0A843XLG2_COLES|nr:hypothetical protein [Colocasia esculenta]